MTTAATATAITNRKIAIGHTRICAIIAQLNAYCSKVTFANSTTGATSIVHTRTCSVTDTRRAIISNSSASLSEVNHNPCSEAPILRESSSTLYQPLMVG